MSVACESFLFLRKKLLTRQHKRVVDARSQSSKEERKASNM